MKINYMKEIGKIVYLKEKEYNIMKMRKKYMKELGKIVKRKEKEKNNINLFKYFI